MGKLGFVRDEKSLLWGGVVLLVVSAGMGVAAAAGAESVVLRLAMALFGTCTGVLLLLLRTRVLLAVHADMAFSDPAKGHVEGAPEADSLQQAAATSPELLHRRLVETDRGRETALVDALREEIRMITEAHRDLITHHRVTKRMLQSLREDEVLDTLIMGIRNGLGFSGAILGVRDPGGSLFFRGTLSGGKEEAVSIPCWEEDSLLARTAWKGTPLLVSSLGDHRHTWHDQRVLGERSSLLVPVFRKEIRRRPEGRKLISLQCSASAVESPRCWIEGFPRPAAQDPDALDRQRQQCARCEMFGVPAILVVREVDDSRPLGMDANASIVSLAEEAALALDIAELYENTRLMSVTDGLTGLTNHREFYVILRRELERARRYSHSVSLLMIDVDDFKRFNDLHGHMAGDRALKTIAGLLNQCVRATDIVARYGGEEFGIILPESSPVGAQMLAERIKTEIAAHNFLKDGRERIQLTVSIGIYTSEGGGESEDLMVGYADEAAYLAKHSGKNRVVVKAHA